MELKEEVEVTTPLLKQKVILRGYVTGRVRQAIKTVYMSGLKVEATDDEDDPISGASLTGELAVAAENKAIEMIVKSIDGQTDNIIDRVLDMPEEDFDFIKLEVDKVQHPLAKTKSSGFATSTKSSPKPKPVRSKTPG